MLYSTEILIPTGTTDKNPLTTSLRLCEGVVRRVWVRWRWGSADLCGAKIYHASVQRWPYTPKAWFPSSVFDTVFEEDYKLEQPPYEVDIQAYNQDDTFPHNLWVAFLVLRPSVNQNVMDFLTYLAYRG